MESHRQGRVKEPGMTDLKQFIRDVPNFPKSGIMFRDITPLLANGPIWRETVNQIADRYRGVQFAARIWQHCAHSINATNQGVQS
jgi:adenine phosphoribosyltransferase